MVTLWFPDIRGDVMTQRSKERQWMQPPTDEEERVIVPWI